MSVLLKLLFYFENGLYCFLIRCIKVFLIILMIYKVINKILCVVFFSNCLCRLLINYLYKLLIISKNYYLLSDLLVICR